MRACFQRRKGLGWAGLFAGLIGGLTATIAMSKFQSTWKTATRGRVPIEENSDRFAGCPATQPTDVETARILLNRLTDIAGYEFSDVTATKAALALHYGVGVSGGLVYFLAGTSVFPRFQKEHSLLAGAAFGAALFLVADIAVLPLMGFPSKGSLSPLGTRLYGMTSHLIYGLTAAEMCNVVRNLL